MTFFKGYLYDNTCTIYLFLSHECYHVPVKHTFALSGQLKAQNLQLLKHTLWDTMHIKWLSTTLNMNGKRIDLPENINIPLWDKVKVRSIMAHKSVKFNIMIKQGNTWYSPKIEMANVRPCPKKKSKAKTKNKGKVLNNTDPVYFVAWHKEKPIGTAAA